MATSVSASEPMSKLVRGLLTVALSVVVVPLVLFAASAATIALPAMTVIAIGATAGAAYGLLAAFLCSYDLSRGEGFMELGLDLTWSLPNTLFGLAVGNLLYPFFGVPSREQSDGQGWISYRSRGYDFGTNVLQTLGTVNLGGRGAHEMVHVTQARILGPFYLPVQAASYAVNFLVQVLFTATIGAVLAATGVRRKAWLEPPSVVTTAGTVSRSAVGGFWGWIYYYTVMELWAYGTEP